MSKTIRIPRSYGFPVAKIYINGKEYTYPSEQDVSVPDEVAEALEDSIGAKTPKEELPYYETHKVVRDLDFSKADKYGQLSFSTRIEFLLDEKPKTYLVEVNGKGYEVPATYEAGSGQLFVEFKVDGTRISIYEKTCICKKPWHVVVKEKIYRPVLSKPYAKLFTNAMDGYIYIDAGQKIKATCEYLEEIYKNNKSVIVDLNGIREFADHIEASYDASAHGVVWKTSRNGKAVDSIK